MFYHQVDFIYKVIFVVDEELRPHRRVELRDAREVSVASRGVASVLLSARALDVCVRDHVAHLRGEGYHFVVMLRRRYRKSAEARGREQLLRTFDQGRAALRGRNYYHRSAFEHIRAAVGEAGELYPRHRMAAEEAEAVLLRESEARFAYGALHAAAVHDKAAAAEIWGSFCQILDGCRGI